ncbi:hypothetical protein [Pseudomonas oryzihabitans]|uniref:hypothetical protein n=1 Tax=Pseudomonas oryzihabitans TaxID=47885 RepID=UPI002856BABE|nr:hypothetical protein [Pseudomonas psychrotolerans]MDR6679855.1 hypothetical protein [Pseudomonas psychrotolerans]
MPEAVEMDTPESGLEQFLAEEVEAQYAQLLLQRAEAAAKGEVVPGASGNAYHVSFSADSVVIEHHYLSDWPAVRVSTEAFIEAVIRWQTRQNSALK